MNPEFSRPVRVEKLPAKGQVVDVSATPDERAALAKRFAILDISHLSARLRLIPVGRGPLVRLVGQLSAEVSQACVVTLEPVAEKIEADFELVFGPPVEEDPEIGEIDLSFEAEGPPDPIVDGAIDVGEAVAESLALELNPFPRAPGAEFTPPDEAAPEVAERANPFAALASFRKNDG